MAPYYSPTTGKHGKLKALQLPVNSDIPLTLGFVSVCERNPYVCPQSPLC